MRKKLAPVHCQFLQCTWDDDDDDDDDDDYNDDDNALNGNNKNIGSGGDYHCISNKGTARKTPSVTKALQGTPSAAAAAAAAAAGRRKESVAVAVRGNKTNSGLLPPRVYQNAEEQRY